MTDSANLKTLLCNGATCPDSVDSSRAKRLEYRSGLPEIGPNVRINLPSISRQLFHVPDRQLDLLEIASYVFAGDRLTSRGNRVAVEYQSWSRNLHFVIRVRDWEFWNQQSVKDSLSTMLEFMTGDARFEFEFQPGHTTPATSLFDREEFLVERPSNREILLFSGGIDSLAGAVHKLMESNAPICLVSHVSQSNSQRTRTQLVSALNSEYNDRVSHYQFRTNLRQIRALDETQRSRLFLFGSVAYVVASTFNVAHFSVFENGITSLNFSRRDDLINARASRTTHPRAVDYLTKFLSLVAAEQFQIKTPFVWITKSQVIGRLLDAGLARLITSSVSCSHTFNSAGGATHCGECYQCVDRRIAMYAAGAHDFDNESLYANDVIVNQIKTPEGKKTIVDYLRQAANFAYWDLGQFCQELLAELEMAYGHMPDCVDEDEFVDKVWSLARCHGSEVKRSLQTMRVAHEEILQPLPVGSLLEIVSDREFLKQPIDLLVEDLRGRLETSIPMAFQSQQPRNERALNDAVEALLVAWRSDLEREHPTVPFACVRAVADFSWDGGHLVIEGKYIRGPTNPTKVVHAMAADLVQYPEESFILFVVHDPERAIANRVDFVNDFEARGRCSVMVTP